MADGQMDGSIHIHPRDASRLPCKDMSVRKAACVSESMKRWSKAVQNSR